MLYFYSFHVDVAIANMLAFQHIAVLWNKFTVNVVINLETGIKFDMIQKLFSFQISQNVQ